jgi:hypothetical protein
MNWVYDFYIPADNKYVEVTGFNKGNYSVLTHKKWISYLRNIVIKKKYVEKIGAKFEFVQYKKLNTVQLKYIRSHLF